MKKRKKKARWLERENAPTFRPAINHLDVSDCRLGYAPLVYSIRRSLRKTGGADDWAFDNCSSLAQMGGRCIEVGKAIDHMAAPARAGSRSKRAQMSKTPSG